MAETRQFNQSSFHITPEVLHDLRNGIHAIKIGLNLLGAERQDEDSFSVTISEISTEVKNVLDILLNLSEGQSRQPE